MRKVSALGEALVDAVLPRRTPQDYRVRRPDQPANAFVNRRGELASEMPLEGVTPTVISEVQLGSRGDPPPPIEMSKTNRGWSDR